MNNLYLLLGLITVMVFWSLLVILSVFLFQAKLEAIERLRLEAHHGVWVEVVERLLLFAQ